MAKYIGVDWASRGWFGVILHDDDTWATDLFPSIWSLWKYHSDAARILIDIPIGLPSDHRRACDANAKSVLQHRHRSVFYAPVRDAVYQPNLEAAKATNEAKADFSIQNQAWSIVSRIREVDEFLDMYPGARDRVLETHPEVCFYALNGRNPLEDSKSTEVGIDRRKALLADEHPEAMRIYEEAVNQYTVPDYAPTVSGVDDIVDALAAAVTARRPPKKRSTLPGPDPPEDGRGLPMQIVYPDDIEQTRLSSLDAHK